MGLFTGKPNPGYLGTAVLTIDGNPNEFRIASLQQFDGMAWNDATICNPEGVADYGKGISEGLCRLLAVWDTGYNQEDGVPVGAEGTLVMNLGNVGENSPSAWDAKVKSRSPSYISRGIVKIMFEFLLTGQGLDFSGFDFNDPSV